jgi:cytochrome d ubiquinol oxidase subunit I
VSAGNSLFTLLGFLGMYSLLSVLWVVVVYQFIETGPDTVETQTSSESVTA